MDAWEMLARLAREVQRFWGPIVIFSYVCGIGCCVTALISAAQQAGDARDARPVLIPLVLKVLAGIFLLALPGALDVMSWTVFRHSTFDVLSYSPPSSDKLAYVTITVYGLGVLGLCAFVRAGLLLYRCADARGSGDSSIGAVIFYLIGGIAGVNFVPLTKIIGATIGGSFGQTLSTIF